MAEHRKKTHWEIEEKERLDALQAQFTRNLEGITPNEYRKEMERLGIDLSWKSSHSDCEQVLPDILPYG